MATQCMQGAVPRTQEWYVLVNWLVENFEEDDLKKIVFFYDYMMEIDDEKPFQQQFYDTVDCDEDKLQAAIKLKNVMKALQYHSYIGVNVADKVQEFIKRLEAFRSQFELAENQLFIGRDEEVKQVIDLLRDEKSIKAVCVCGIGGQGKSQLARKVCRQLAVATPNLVLVKADLRNKHNVENVITALLADAQQGYSSSGGQDILLELLKQYIEKVQTDILFCLDDCDEVMKKDRYGFKGFLENILKIAAGQSEKSVRFLLTTREKLPSRDSKEDDGYTRKFSGQLAEVELRELGQSDAVELLKKCSNTDMDDKLTSAIAEECAYSPLALTVVSDLLKSEKFTPERLLFHLKMDKKNVTHGLKVDRCIGETIHNLNMNIQKALVCLSVFQSSPFEMESARKVIEDPENKMQELYNCHLVEVEDSRRSAHGTGHRNLYSLHPLVYRYISEWKKPRELSEVYKNACQKFVSLYERIISNIVRLLESKYWKGHRKLEFHKVHILNFYEIMTEHPELLKKHQKHTNDADVLIKKRVSDLADILLSLVKNRRMFQSEADRALKQKNHAVYIFWMVEKADIFLMLHDKVEIALEILNELTDRFPVIRDLRDEPFYPCLVHGLFHKVKGLCRWKQQRYQDALAFLHLSLKFFELCASQSHRRDLFSKSPYASFVAKVYCYLGIVHIDTGELDVADQHLRTGHELLKGMVESRERENDELTEELHWDIPRYYSQYAKIKLMKAKTTGDLSELDHALEDLERGIHLDERLKLDYLDGYYSKLKLRADINIEKGLLEKALDDANFVLDRRRGILQPPHTHYTESVYQVGRIYMLIGNELYKKQETDRAHRYWICASDYFKELKDCHLKDGGIALDNPVFQDIKRDHLKVTELTGNMTEVKKMETFYKRVEAGDYEPEKASSIKAMKQMLWTPVEMITKYFGGGGQEFGDNDQTITKLENLAIVQEERMMRGEPSGGARKDSGMGHSSSDFSDSMSSGSGSMSERISRMHLEKSLSMEDEVFQESVESIGRKRPDRLKKRQKTIDESQED